MNIDAISAPSALTDRVGTRPTAAVAGLAVCAASLAAGGVALVVARHEATPAFVVLVCLVAAWAFAGIVIALRAQCPAASVVQAMAATSALGALAWSFNAAQDLTGAGAWLADTGERDRGRDRAGTVLPSADDTARWTHHPTEPAKRDRGRVRGRSHDRARSADRPGRRDRLADRLALGGCPHRRAERPCQLPGCRGRRPAPYAVDRLGGHRRYRDHRRQPGADAGGRLAASQRRDRPRVYGVGATRDGSRNRAAAPRPRRPATHLHRVAHGPHDADRRCLYAGSGRVRPQAR